MDGQNAQGQPEGNENVLLRFVMLLNDGSEHPKRWMSKLCGQAFRGSCQRAYKHLLGNPRSDIKPCVCSSEQKAEIARAYEAHRL